LEELILRGAGRHLPVVVDFDHTMIRGDVQEALLGELVRSGALPPTRVPATLSPSFRLPGRELTRLDSCADVTAYYEAFLSPTVHGESDPAPLTNAYVWAVEVLDGFRLSEVLDATRAAVGAVGLSPLSPTSTDSAAMDESPLAFRPEMVELVAELIRHEFDVWIVSASNVWSVRWMVQHALNPQLRTRGLRAGLPPDHVIGIATLLADAEGHLYKDAVLVREDAAYAQLTERVQQRFRLTSRLEFPVPAYAGKVACIWDAIGRRPFLAIGDSPNDHAMLAFSEHRLWLDRGQDTGHQRQLAKLIRQTGPAGWLVQAVATHFGPGFVPVLDSLPRSLRALVAPRASAVNGRAHQPPPSGRAAADRCMPRRVQPIARG
jgi:hypothetical protein